MAAVRAAVLRERGGPLRVEEIDLPEPGPGQVRVALAATGVCHSDLSLANGTLAHKLPVVLGHEGAGRVTAVGEGVTAPAPGDPVVLNWAPACRACWWCGHGEPWLCARAADAAQRPYARLADGGEVFPGLGTAAFATGTVVGAHACIPLPGDIPLAEAALLGCAVLTGVGAVLNSARVRPGESVVVIGLGGVGLAAVQGAKLAGADPILAVDPVQSKGDLARRFGAAEVLTPGPGLAREIRALIGGRGADHAIECVGRAESIRAAWSATRRGGRATVVGLGAATDEVTFNALEIGYFARTLSGCVYGSTDPAVDIPRLLEHYRAGRLDLAALVTDRIGLDQVGDAMARLGTGAGARSVVTFTEDPAPLRADQGPTDAS
jgi:S-(hydroxymethyl)glutathione dehydrogenase/alcohol dehydrogenase